MTNFENNLMMFSYISLGGLFLIPALFVVLGIIAKLTNNPAADGETGVECLPDGSGFTRKGALKIVRQRRTRIYEDLHGVQPTTDADLVARDEYMLNQAREHADRLAEGER